jgi:hypothetical protein
MGVGHFFASFWATADLPPYFALGLRQSPAPSILPYNFGAVSTPPYGLLPCNGIWVMDLINAFDCFRYYYVICNVFL